MQQLNQKPVVTVSIADTTCDSDGKVASHFLELLDKALVSYTYLGK